jgi:hypothetical protein
MVADDSSPLKELKQSQDALRKAIEKQTTRIERLAGSAARQEWRELLRAIPDARRLEHWGRKVYSQNDEDGILAEIFRRLGVGAASGIFVEIGASNGLENNTHLLLRQGFSGVWVDGAGANVQKMRTRFADYLADCRLSAQHLRVTAENIDATLTATVAGRPVAVLSIDVDGNDYWLWKAVRSIEPPVVVIEYNGKFPPPLAIVQRYRADHVWTGTDYFGASLAAMEKLARAKGTAGGGTAYSLVGCNVTGSNAFFVRDDLVQDHFPYAQTAEHLYHPCRYHLMYDCFASAGHKPDVGPFEYV